MDIGMDVETPPTQEIPATLRDRAVATVAAIVGTPRAAGEILSHEWLRGRGRLEIAFPGLDDRWTYRDTRTAELTYLAGMDAVRDLLLTKHRLALRSVPGEGYEILSPAEQVAYGKRLLSEGVARAMEKAVAYLVHLDATDLPSDALRRRSDSLAHAGTLRAALHPPADKSADDPPPPGYRFR